VCGREFRPEVVQHLNELARQQPAPSGNTLARETCALLAWYGPSGQPAVSSAKVALRKLHNYTGLRQTSGLGPLGEDKGQGLWLQEKLAAAEPVGRVGPRAGPASGSRAH
jgi:hypothetical protein